jgi:transposase
MSEPSKPSPPRRQPSEEEGQHIVELHQMGYGTRQIARRLPYSRKIVRQVLEQAGLSALQTQPSKLAPFHILIEQKVRQGLTTSRILREIRAAGYRGGRTILADLVRQMHQSLGTPPPKQVKRRFETPAGQEMQIDWSPYQVPIGDHPVKVHVLGCLLCHSRKLFLHFFADERQPTLLEGLAMAFEYFEGCAHRLVLDNMSTAVVGRTQSEGEVLWNQRFAEFARHYGFEPFACKPRDPDRKGKKEKSFRLVWEDFLKGAEFASWEDLNARARLWLDQTPGVGNLRVHGTTRRVPNEVWGQEQPLLIALPEQRFGVYEQSVRVVDQDSTLSVRGTRYSVPCALAGRSVAVKLFAEHFEVLDAHGRLAWSRRYVPAAEHGRLIIDPTHYATMRRRSRHNPERLDTAFLARFPTLAPLVRGLQLKMKSLAGVHLRALLRLVDRYGTEHFLDAAEHAQSYRRFDARAVQRILEQRRGPGEEPSVPPLGSCAPDLVPDGEPGDLGSYAHLDTKANAERSDAVNDDSPHLDDHPTTKDDDDNNDNEDNPQEQ